MKRYDPIFLEEKSEEGKDLFTPHGNFDLCKTNKEIKPPNYNFNTNKIKYVSRNYQIEV